MEGRFALLANLTGLTTVTRGAERVRTTSARTAPAFATRSAGDFVGSRDAGHSFGTCSSTCVSVIPWLPVWLVVVGVAWLIYRRLL